jgi:hypothetical protein
MKIIKSYGSGFGKAAGSVKIISIIYGITLLLGLTAAFVFNSSVSDSVGRRPEIFRLLKDFDFTVYSDFMSNYGDLIRPIFAQFIWTGVLYFFFTVFFAGGILKYFDGLEIKNKSQAFFAASARYFFRFLRLGIYTLLIQILFFALIAVIFSAVFVKNGDSAPEPVLFTIMIFWVAAHVLFFVLISIVSDYAKIILVRENSKSVWPAIWNGFKFTFGKIYLTLPLYIILLVFPLALTGIYLLIENSVSMENGITILLLLVIQQLYIWTRIFAKTWILGSEYDMYNTCLAAKIQPLLTQEILLNESL